MLTVKSANRAFFKATNDTDMEEIIKFVKSPPKLWTFDTDGDEIVFIANGENSITYVVRGFMRFQEIIEIHVDRQLYTFKIDGHVVLPDCNQGKRSKFSVQTKKEMERIFR